MSNKVVTVEPYTPTYRVHHKPTGEVHGDFVHLIEAVNFAKSQPKRHYQQKSISFTFKSEPDGSYTNWLDGYLGYLVPRRFETLYYPAAEWVITDDTGRLVGEEAVKAVEREEYMKRWDDRQVYYREYDERRNMLDRRLVRKKGSGHKIKTHYQMYERLIQAYRGGVELDYRNDVMGYFRRPDTLSERRANAGIVADYGESFVRGKRRGGNLPSAWDDLTCGYHDKRKSWKHHSKRRKQWKPK